MRVQVPPLPPHVVRIDGPYRHTDGKRWFIIVNYANGRVRSVSLARWLMEHHLGRELSRNEHVDHINEDCTDDRLDNLQILTLQDNAKKYHRLKGKPAEYTTFLCPMCLKQATRETRHIKHNNQRRGCAGPFCSKSYAGKYSARQRFPQ